MLSLIAAVGKNNELGKNNKLLWHLPDDLKRFKELTTGHIIIMGRKTFESLPKILPNREHLILTRNKSYHVEDDRVTIYHSIDNLINSLDEGKENFVIGGGEIYRLFLPYVEKIYLTRVDQDFEADTFFPVLDHSQWQVIEETPGKQDENYRFLTLKRL